MLRTKWFNLVSLLVVVAMLLGAWQPVLAQESPPAPEPQGLRPDAPPYGVRGMYPVGVRDFSIDAGDHVVDTTVWYPALNPDNVEEEVTYTIGAGVPNMAGLPISGRAIADAAPDTAQGPYPLVIFSPGLSAWRQANSYLLEHLASFGFVVMATDPRGETYEQFWEGAATRPIDTQLTIDYAEALTADDGALEGLIDIEHIATVGHSSGGWSALLGGGAQMDLGWCAANPELVAENELSNCAQFVPNVDQIADMLGLDAAPTGMWPPTNDPRVDAVIALAPDGDIWGAEYEGVSMLKAPTLVVAGSRDTVNVSERAAYPIYEHLGSVKKGLLVFENADHQISFNQCRDTPWMVPDFFWACADAVWDMDRAHDLINHFATAFLLAELKGDAEAAAALAPESVNFPGIEYQAEGYAPAPAATLDEATIAKIEAMVEKMMVDTGTPGYALGIVKDGQIVYTKGFGVERVGEDTPVTEHTVFGTGCVGKTAVATALMQLVDAGKIDLDAPATDYLPYFKLADERYKEITIRQLITHRSGLPEIEDWISSPVEYDDGVLERYVRSLDNTKLLFAPGERWSYTSMGYTVLADVIQKVTGQTFEDYLQQHILDPLRMEDTLLIVGEADQAHVAGNHVHDNAGEVVVSDIFPYRRQFAAGGPLYSSISDLARYALAHLNRGELDGQRILPAADYDAMWEPISAMNVPLFPALQAHYGMGWFVGALDGHRAVGHFGADEGYAALMLLAPDDNAGLVLASDFFDWDEFDISGWETGIDIMKMLLAEGE